MKYLEYLPPKIAAIVRRNALLYGTPPEGWQYPTMDELMAQDEMRKMRRECNAFMRQHLAAIAAREAASADGEPEDVDTGEDQRNSRPT
ncbi:hypothetical protein HFK89_24795 [Ralstonia pseudosolanacearum]|uniref:hypothetical protein n=1 Tax=Ralstonia pseudosolanacearum TaxID=1310165 RepID=UPI001113E3E9|nr:hypothetical protein [Ralstonia pseudosolanacearum]MCK4165562.1 hypothetical protein [Ralstonia pseudosolanacearum]